MTLGDVDNYGGLQTPAPAYKDVDNSATPYGGGKAKKAPAPPPPPEVEFLFHVVDSAITKSTQTLIENSMSMVQYIWKPRPDDNEKTKQFAVTSKWSGSFKTIEDKQGFYKRIDFPLNAASDKALKLVKDNFSTSTFDPVVPVFICFAAWDESEEPGVPRDGLLRGFTLVKALPWFTGDRAIFLFSSSCGPRTLAHELSHWTGFSHRHFEEDSDNVGLGGGKEGFAIDREQLRKYHRWATEQSFRKTMAGK